MDEDQFIKNILMGIPKAYQRLREIMLPSIKKLMSGEGNQQDVDNLFDEAVTIFFEKARKPGFQLTSKVETFLYGICQRVLWNQRMKKSFSNEDTFGDFTKLNNLNPAPETDFTDVERERLLNKSLLRLDEPCRKLLETYYLDEKSRKEVAQEMGYTDTHVSKKSEDCLRKLKKIIMSFSEYGELFKQ